MKFVFSCHSGVQNVTKFNVIAILTSRTQLNTILAGRGDKNSPPLIIWETKRSKLFLNRHSPCWSLDFLLSDTNVAPGNSSHGNPSEFDHKAELWRHLWHHLKFCRLSWKFVQRATAISKSRMPFRNLESVPAMVWQVSCYWNASPYPDSIWGASVMTVLGNWLCAFALLVVGACFHR